MKIKISDENIRKKFFDLIKENLNKSWKEIRNESNLSKSSLERYKSGKSLIPEELFLRFLNILKESEKKNISGFIERVPNNLGQIKGGKMAYSINFRKFQEGRKKAALLNKTKKKKTFVFNVELSNDICEFIGAFIGDGFFNSYNNKLYQVEFSGDSRFDFDYYDKRIIPIIRGIIPDIKPKIYKREKNSIRVVFYSKALFCFLKDFFGFLPGKKAHTVSIPEKIINSEVLTYSTIRGIFDTDGGIFLDRREKYRNPYPRIIFQTVSKNLYVQLVEKLLENFKLHSRFDEKRKIYLIEIYGYTQLKKWMSLIGFSNKRHLDKIASVAQG